MTTNATNLFVTVMLAFAEKAFRMQAGKKLDLSQRYIEFVVHALEKFFEGDVHNLLVNLPGRHLKTFLCCVCFPAFALARDPTLKFIIVTYNEDLAEDIVRQIRALMTSAWFQKITGTRIAKGHSLKSDFLVVGGGRVRAVALNSVTGKGADYIIFDDPHNVSDWKNTQRKEKVIEAFEVLTSRGDDGSRSKMLVVGHRVAIDDLSAHIIERSDFVRIALPLFAPKKMVFTFGDKTLRLAKGEALRPDAFPCEHINKMLKNHRGSPFWLYHQQGLGSREDEFQLEITDFPILANERLGDILGSSSAVVLSVDTTQSTNSVSRNVVHAYAIQGNRYLLFKVFSERCSFNRLANKIKRFANAYRAAAIIVENTARGPDLIERLESELKMSIWPVNPRGSKSDRLRECASIIKAKRVIIRSRPEIEDAMAEIISFPYAPNDDNVDALTNFLLELPKLKLQPQFNPPPAATFGSSFASRPNGTRQTVDGIASVRGRSVFGWPRIR